MVKSLVTHPPISPSWHRLFFAVSIEVPIETNAGELALAINNAIWGLTRREGFAPLMNTSDTMLASSSLRTQQVRKAKASSNLLGRRVAEVKGNGRVIFG